MLYLWINICVYVDMHGDYVINYVINYFFLRNKGRSHLKKRLEKKRDTITMEFNVTVCDLSPRRRTKDDKGD